MGRIKRIYTKRGAYNLFKQGKLPNATQLPTGTKRKTEKLIQELNND